MLRLRGRTGSMLRWLTSFGAALAIAAQLAVALVPLVERGGGSAAAHVEAGGTATHYAHNDATCAVCQARLLRDFAPRIPDGPFTTVAQAEPGVAASTVVVVADAVSPGAPRAPPAA